MMDYRETYLSWYKSRMNAISDPNTYSLMSSSVREPWDTLQKHREILGETGFNERFYVSNAYGLPSLTEGISNRYHVPRSSILVTQGVTSALFLLTSTCVSAGSHVVVESPGYEPLRLTARQCGADVGFLNRPTDTPFDMDHVSEVLQPKTSMVILTNLHNPTGKEITEHEIRSILEIMKKLSPRALLVIDEIYRDFVPGSHVPACMIDDRVITVSSLTKVYGLSLLRCGWIMGVPGIIERLRPVQVLMSGIGSRYLEALSTVVFDHMDEYRSRNEEFLHVNREILQRGLIPLFDSGYLDGIIPNYGCTSFLRLNHISDTRQFTDFLEKEYGVYCVPGQFFGDSGCIRAGIGEIDSGRLEIAVNRFCSGLKRFLESVRE